MAKRSDEELNRLLPPGGALKTRVFKRLAIVLNAEAALGAGTRIGYWCVRELLGRGAASSVYLADRADGRADRQAALKIVRSSEKLVERFRGEIPILAKLRHPAIARLIDCGELGDHLWFAMEPVFGERIDLYVRSRRLPLMDRIALFESVCDAVSYAHGRQLIHRDIKPGNLLVDEAGRPRLLDFGIGASERSMALAYTSPEQCSGAPLTATSDIYQLGLLLRALLMPDDRPCRTLPQTPRAIVMDELSAVIAHATEHDPSRRYATAATLRDDLRAIRCRRPISLIGGWRYPFARFVERNATSSASAIMGFVSLLATGWSALRRVEVAAAPDDPVGP